MKKMYSLMMMLATMGAMLSDEQHKELQEQLTPEELEEIKRVRNEKALERKKKQGLKEWDIDGVKVIALNKKNASRKANNIKQLLKQNR